MSLTMPVREVFPRHRRPQVKSLHLITIALAKEFKIRQGFDADRVDIQRKRPGKADDGLQDGGHMSLVMQTPHQRPVDFQPVQR